MGTPTAPAPCNGSKIINLIETDEGEWHDGRQIGKGVQNWPIGRYEGELADGLPNGKGVLTFAKISL